MRKGGQSVAHSLYKGEMSMEKPRSVVYANDGQTKITRIGRWFHMTAEEIEADYERRLEEGDPIARRINNVLCDILERRADDQPLG